MHQPEVSHLPPRSPRTTSGLLPRPNESNAEEEHVQAPGRRRELGFQ